MYVSGRVPAMYKHSFGFDIYAWKKFTNEFYSLYLQEIKQNRICFHQYREMGV